MAKLPTISLGAWTAGIDNVSAASALLSDRNGRVVAVRDAVNVQIGRDGWPQRRPGRVQVATRPALERLWACPLGAFAQSANALYRVSASGQLTWVTDLNSDHQVAYTVLNDAVVVSSRSTLLEVRGNTAQNLALPDALAPDASAVTNGGLAAGRYTVAAAWVRGQTEGSLSRLRTVQVPAGGGIKLAAQPPRNDMTALRIYRTRPDGDALRHAQDVAPGAGPVVLGSGLVAGDRLPPGRDLRAMPGGELVAAWRGRLLVVRGTCLYASDAMNYGLYSPRHGFVPFPRRITMLAPVEGGVFVGTRDGVSFLSGPRPREWTLQHTGALPPIPGTQAELDGALLSPGAELGGQRVALWLAPNGYVVGTASGQIVEWQGSRLQGITGAGGRTCVHGRRVTTVLDSGRVRLPPGQ